MKYKNLSNILIILTCYYFIHSFIIQTYLPNYEYQDRILFFIVDLTMILIGIYCYFHEKNKFIKLIFLLFIIFSTSTFLVNMYDVDFLSHLNGLRDTLVLFSSIILMRFVFNSSYRYIFFKRFSWLILIITIIQLPISIYQFTIYGASDYVGGSLGFGGSGLLTLLLFLSSFYFIIVFSINLKSYLHKIFLILLISLLLVPTFINETKISFLYMSVYFLLQLEIKKNVLKSGAILFIGIIVIVNLANYYLEFNNIDPIGFADENYVTDYLSNTNENVDDISRVGKIIILYDIMKTNNIDLFFGKGFGLFKGQNILGQTKLGNNLTYLTTGSRNLIFESFLQGGLFYLILILALLFYLINGIYGSSIPNIQNYKIMILFVFVTSLFYNSSLFYGPYAIWFSFFILWPNYIDSNKYKIK